MKPDYTFHFIDEPQFKTTASRADIANRLRAYRHGRNAFKITRLSAHRFAVQCTYPGSPVALMEVATA